MQKTRCAATAVLSRLAGKGTSMVLALFFVVFSVTSSIYIYAGTRVASAAASSTINFQARVLQSSGAVVADGSYSVQFKLYDAASAGTNEWTETQTLVAKNGYITASLGSVTGFSGTIDWSQEHWLTLNVNGDGEMGPTRMKLTAVPYSFRSGQADVLTNGSGTITAAGLLQLSSSSIQSTNSATPALQVNQQGSGQLLKLQSSGTDKFTVSNAGDVSAAGGITIGNSTSTTAGTIRWTGSAFEGYNGSAWASLGGGLVLSSGSYANFTSGLQNVAGTTTGVAAEMLVFTSATAVSNTAGVTGFTAPAAGSFRTCLVKNNAAITAGTLNLRWRVNGASVGAAACSMSAAVSRQSATSLNAGVVTFSAGDTIGIAFDTVGMTPAATNDFTVYWSVEYSSSSSGLTMQKVYDSSSAPVSIVTTDNKDVQYLLSNTATDSNFLVNIASGSTSRFAVQNNGTDVLSVNASGVTTGALSATALTGTSYILGTDTVTDFTGTGLELVGGAVGVKYGSLAGTAVEGSTSLTCASGSGNLSGGGNTITLGAGGSCGNIGIIGNPTFIGLVTASGFSGDGSALTSLNASNINSGTVDDLRLSSNVTLMGNTFNGANGLVKLDGTGALPALSGAALTSLNAANIGSGTINDLRLSGNVTLKGNSFNGNSELVLLDASGALPSLTASALTGLNATNIASGALSDARLSTNVTLMGSTFNAANKLVQLDGTGALTALNGSALTNLNASNVASGTISDGRLSTNVALLNVSQSFTSQKTFESSIIIGTDASTPQAGTITLHDNVGSNSFTSVLGTNSLTSSRNINLPDEGGTICLRNSTSCGYVMLASGSAQTDSTTNASVFINKTGASGNLMTLQKNGTTVVSVLNSGALQLQLTNTAAFTVSSAGGTQYFGVDTSGGLVQIGSATTDGTAILTVLDAYNSATDPTGTNGGSYYNSATAKSRCFENSIWTDCISAINRGKPADQTVTNNATFQNDTSLVYAMAANSSYRIEATINYSTTSNVADFKYTFTIPAGATVFLATDADTSATARTICNITASGQTCALANTSNFRGIVKVTGIVTTAATAGNIQFQFAQNNLTAAQSVTVYKGSLLTAVRTDL